ncbi:MAG TPA: carbon-nitrogen hydrolase family protein [Solirubrobacteraceae bacterium]|nr:carbon-nitrogen hydrolase family protein [Solirubrobacteraceae bacterium]
MPVETRRVVAVQLAARPGEVERNLRHIADVVGQAVREHRPDMVFLPEVSCAPNLAHSMMGGCVRPVDGGPLAAYRSLAREHGCLIGGGALTIRGRDARNTYYLCEPDGSVHLHDKDQPSMWENVTYAAGEDEGVCVTRDGPIGVPNGFEWIRTRTAARLRGRVRLVAGGMCFPSFPTWRVTRPYFWEREHGLMLDLARESPGRLARVVGAPAVHASHVGDVVMQTPLAPRIPWPTILVGETQITDERGAILERLTYDDGEGYVAADVAWRPPEPLDPVPDRFWMTTLPLSVQAIWHAENARGRALYRWRHRRGAHPFQRDAGYGLDLADHVPAAGLSRTGGQASTAARRCPPG